MSKQKKFDWMTDLLRNDKGKPTGSVANVLHALRHAPEWQGVLKFNEFTVKAEIHAKPRFANFDWNGRASDWQDAYDTLTLEWLHRQGIPASAESVGRAVWVVANEKPYHPIREYLDGLKWDGTPRLDNWLITYAKADTASDDKEYAKCKMEHLRPIATRLPFSTARPIYKPGCQVDHVLVLEGRQNIGKSSLLRTLFNEWFTDRLPRIDTKDASQATFGVWCIEISEMAVWSKAESEEAKSYITARFERFRPPYAKNFVDQPRQCVFAGTINPTLGGYLKDPTGNRRYWVVAVSEIDLKAAAADREQLFAEAVARYKAGSVWHFDDIELVKTAEHEQAERYQSDAWEDTVAKFVKDLPNTDVTEILEHALHIETGRMNQADKNRVARIMTGLGWHQKSVRIGDKTPKRWVNPNPPNVVSIRAVEGFK